MSNYHSLPLVDLTSHYLVYLDGIDAENQSRHRQGDALMAYPSFEEFVELCREKAVEPKAKVCTHVLEFDGFDRVLDVDFGDEPDLKWLLPLPAIGIVPDHEEFSDSGMPEESVWATSHGSFAFVSSSKH